MASTSSYASEIQAAFRACDTSRFLKSLPEELLFGNENADDETMFRNDNSSVVDHSHSINSATEGKVGRFSRELKRSYRFGRLVNSIAYPRNH